MPRAPPDWPMTSRRSAHDSFTAMKADSSRQPPRELGGLLRHPPYSHAELLRRKVERLPDTPDQSRPQRDSCLVGPETKRGLGRRESKYLPTRTAGGGKISGRENPGSARERT